MNLSKLIAKIAFLAVLPLTASLAPAAQLSTEARTAIPHEVQQLVVIDYRVMQNSSAAMDLRERVMPPELRQLEEALSKAGLNENHDVEQLAFALYRAPATAKEREKGTTSESLATVGIAQGQFPVQDILANFRKQKIKAALVRTNKLYPLGKSGMVACFVDNSTMVFGSTEAVTQALDAHDGQIASLLTNSPMMDAMRTIDADPLWSILDQKGTETMMKSVLGEAGSVTDFESVRKRLQSSWYGMDFQHGVKFNFTLSTGDTFTSATISSLLNAAVVVRRMSGSEAEKQALAETKISSDSGRLTVHFATSDASFNALLQSPLFKSMVR
jgi:hypothetical protein